MTNKYYKNLNIGLTEHLQKTILKFNDISIDLKNVWDCIYTGLTGQGIIISHHLGVSPHTVVDKKQGELR